MRSDRPAPLPLLTLMDELAGQEAEFFATQSPAANAKRGLGLAGDDGSGLRCDRKLEHGATSAPERKRPTRL